VSVQSWCQALITAEVAGPLLSDSAVETSILPAEAKLTLPANFLSIGSTLRFTFAVQVSNVAVAPGTFIVAVRFGATDVFTTGAATFQNVANTNLPLWAKIVLTCRAIGAAASFQGIYLSYSKNKVASAGSNSVGVACNAGTTATFDSTAAQVIDLMWTFSASTDPTNVTLQQYVLESVN